MKEVSRDTLSRKIAFGFIGDLGFDDVKIGAVRNFCYRVADCLLKEYSMKEIQEDRKNE